MKKRTLFYAIIGQRGVFSVDIALKKTVGHLKIAIKQVEVHENMLKSIDANNLELFHGGMLLEFRSDHVQQLREGGTTHLIDSLTQKNKELLETSILENMLANKYTTDPLAPEHIHVLVKIPKAKRSRQREADDIRLLKQ
ncbi:hypothetical protein GN244_ATG02287 [Phytophthora infestans]|uniref:Crinkler effector protein N-terminal domain-containing protein n=1 Tax=Phytophthora infestans TaxID=4787 RepID=A0A833T149_PHYIN|nr:hypothetical protein GN244_ATG02287 [Phytophthora infestans]KAF4148091.1 hypothetical protein GN958_ATG02717 [Phytophthora infestans]KAF4148195.1 hypothetical protein GN958_ATG02619 [Phytophthora infestans]